MNSYILRCPHCDADLVIENDLDTYYCPYCNGKIILTDMDESQINARRRIKELNLKHEQERFKIKAESREKDKEFERERIRTKEKRIQDNYGLIILVGVVVLCIISMLIISIASGEFEKKIPVPLSSSDFKKMNWEDAEDLLQETGFKNITCQQSNKKPGLFEDNGEIDTLSIDGKKTFRAGKQFSKKAKIVIIYFPEKTDS